MAAADVSTFMKIWFQSDQPSERKMKKILDVGLDEVVRAMSGVLPHLKVGKPLAGPVWRWMEEWGYPQRVTAQLGTTTLTLSGNLFGAAVTEEALKQVIRVGTILERPSDRVQAKVSSIAGSASLQVTVAAYGNTTLSDDTGPVSWDIISEPWYDYRDAEQPRSLDRTFREVGTQIHAETFEIPWTRQNTEYEIVPDETEHQITRLLLKLRKQIATAVLRSRPYYSSGYKYGNQVQDPTMCGLCTWPEILQSELANTNVYVDKAGIQLEKSDLDNLVRNMWLDEHSDFNTGDWWIVTHPITHGYIHDFDISYRRKEASDKSVGFSVEVFDSKIGKTFPILSDPYMREGDLLVVDFSKASWGYYKNDTLNRKEIPTSGRYRRWLLSFQTYGVVLRQARQSIGMIYGLPTS